MPSLPIEDAYWLFQRHREELLTLLKESTQQEHHGDVVKNCLFGSIKFPDAYVVWGILQQLQPQRILEIGSFLGFSTRMLLVGSQEWNGHVTAVDPDIRHRIFDNPGIIQRQYNARFVEQGRLEVQRAFFGSCGGSVDWHYTNEIAADATFRDRCFAERPTLGGQWGRQFDCIFLDGDHAYESARDNFEHALQLLAPSGVILLHDPITWDGVARLLDELRDEYPQATVHVVDGRRVLDHPHLATEPMRAVDGIGIFRSAAGTTPVEKFAA